MRRHLPWLSLLLASLACSQSDAPTNAVGVAAPRAALSRPEADFSGRNADASAPVPAPAPAPQMVAGQKLIRTGELQVHVSNVTQSTHTADSIVQAGGGLLADRQVSQDDSDGRQARLVFRIPSERFAEVNAALQRLGEVRSETMNTQDITKAYADLETRLAVQEQTVTRLRALLDTRTAKLSDVLDVERELGRAITELEQMKGERRYYDQQVALSTLTLILFESTPSRLSQLTRPVANAFHGALEVLGTSLAGVIYAVVFLLPWLVIVAAVGWAILRLRRKFPRRGTPAPKAAPTPQPPI